MTCHNAIISTPILITLVQLASFDRCIDDLSRPTLGTCELNLT